MAKPNTKNTGKKKAPKFRRRSEARPDEVLDAALELFMEKGFSATRVEDIAKRAGLSKGAVYLYFSSKEALLEGLVRRAIVPVAESTLATLGQFDGDPHEMLPVIMQALAMRLNDPKFFAIPKIIMREALVAPQIAAIYRTAVLDRVVPMLTGIVAKGIADGYFRPVNPEMAVRSIVGPILAHILLAEIFGVKSSEGTSIETLIETHITILFDGLSMPEGAS
jgi:AcrR family transcriptional regulator